LLAQSDHDLQGMDDAWDVTKDGEQDVDEQVAAATALKEDTERWQEDGDDDLADVAETQMLSVSSPT
jgi:hypothetical protein